MHVSRVMRLADFPTQRSPVHLVVLGYLRNCEDQNFNTVERRVTRATCMEGNSSKIGGYVHYYYVKKEREGILGLGMESQLV